MAAPHVADRAVGLQHEAYLVPRPVVAGLAKPFFNEHELQPNSAAHDVPLPSGAAGDAAPGHREYE